MNPPLQQSAEKSFPRVLVVYHSCINLADQHGVSIRGWFAQWPKENLAQIYSGQESGRGEFFGSSYKLRHRDRWFGRLFFWLKGSPLGEASIQVVTVREAAPRASGSSLHSHAKRIFGRFLLKTGFWELLFPPKLSIELVDWVKQFKPDIIYCQGYTLGFTWLPLMLKHRFGLPICFQTGDDWPEVLYRDSPISFLMRPVVRASAKKLIRTAALRFANGPDMAAEYSKRYQVAFEPMMMSDDYNRFNECIPIRIPNHGEISIMYTGNLSNNRWQSIADLCLAAEELRSDGLDFQITGMVSSVPPEDIELMSTFSNFRLLPAPSHDDLPRYLKGADILFLAEPFDDKRVVDIRLSISTKAHLYMMSERPALIYAPATTGIMSYAGKVGMGFQS